MKYLKILLYFIKIPLAIVLSPLLYLLFKVSPTRGFLTAFTFFWPHLDILDENDKLYLRRFFFTPKTRWYRPRFLHFIAQSDKGRFPHSHPGPFITTILYGGYVESVYYPFTKKRTPFVHAVVKDMKQYNPIDHVHMVELINPTWSWVKGWIRGKPWYFYDLDPIDFNKDKMIESNVYTSKGKEIKSWQ